MLTKILPALTLSLLAAACVAPEEYTVRTDSMQNVAYQPGVKYDIERGIWGTQTITPPPGLIATKQSNIVGQTIYDNEGQPALHIESVLVDPTTGEARYAVTSSREFGDYLVVPLSAMRISPNIIQVDMSRRQIARMPRFAGGDLVARYPYRDYTGPVAIVPGTTTTTTVYTPVPQPVYGLPQVAVGSIPPPPPLPPLYQAAPVPSTEPLQLVRRGSVVGTTVVDVNGQYVGVVDAVAVVPANGEVRYAIVSGPSFGPGYYIAVPATSTYLNSGRIVLVQPAPTWMQSPRYTAGQVQQYYGPLGVVG